MWRVVFMDYLCVLNSNAIDGGMKMVTSGKCIKCKKPISYGNLYCKACGGTGICLAGHSS